MVQRLFADVINDAIWFMNIHEQNHPWFLAMILLHVPCAPFLSFSTIYVLLQFLTPLASMRIAIFRHFVFLMLLPVHTFFLHSSFQSGSFVQCAQLFLQFLTFPIPGRSIIIALSGDAQPRIKAPLPFQNILSRPWSVKISLTDGPSCWIHLVKPWICGLSSILHCLFLFVYFFYFSGNHVLILYA